MRINFLIPTTGLTGGVKVIFIHANSLAGLGHEVRLIYPYCLEKNPPFKRVLSAKIKKFRRLVLKLLGRDNIGWHEFAPGVKLIRVNDLSAENIPPAEATIATANETADWLNGYPADRGKKFYFIQDYETWTRDPAAVDATWRLPLKKIVVAGWLKKLAEEKFGQPAPAVVPDGVDTKIFYNPDKKINPARRVLLMYHPLAKKGFAGGLAAFRLAKRQKPELNLTLFGAYRLPRALKREFVYHYKPGANELRELYASHDIFLWPSLVEGFGLPPLEAMACQCAVIATATGAVGEYAVNGQSAIIIPPGDYELMAKKILELAGDDAKLSAISRAAGEQAGRFNWPESSRRLEKLLLEN